MIIGMITIPETLTQGINIAIIVFYLVFLVRGAKKGVLLQILTTIGTFAAFLGAWRYCSFAQDYMNLWPTAWNPFANNPMIARAAYVYMNETAWFFVLFIIIRLFFLLLEKLASGLSSLPVIKEISGILGGLLGVACASVWILLFSMILNTPLFANGAEIFESTLMKNVNDGAAYLSEAIDAPVTSTEVFNRLYKDFRNIDGKDKEFLQKWLKDHGFEPLPENVDLSKIPAGISLENLPEGISLENLPEGFSLEDIPEGFSLDDLPEGVTVNDIPAGMTIEDLYALRDQYYGQGAN